MATKMQHSTTKSKIEPELETDEQLLDLYMDHVLGIGHTEKGVNQYLVSVRRFMAFLEDRNGPSDYHLANATQRDVDAWVSAMRKRGNAQNTRRVRLNALMAVAKYGALPLKDTIVIPARDLSGTERLKRQVMDADEYDNMSKNMAETYHHYRNLGDPHKVRGCLVVMTGLECALRISEIIDLDVGDVFLEPMDKNPTIEIHGKGAMQRSMRLSEGLYNAIIEYRDNLRPKDATSDAMFVSRTGKRLPDKSTRETFYRYSTKFVGRRLSPHQYRRSTITSWHRARVNPEVIRQWAGHQSISTTYMSYVSATPKDVAEAEEARLNGNGSVNHHMGPQDNGTDAKEALRRLEGLKVDGLISEDEHQKMKAEILSKYLGINAE